VAGEVGRQVEGVPQAGDRTAPKSSDVLTLCTTSHNPRTAEKLALNHLVFRVVMQLVQSKPKAD
jgi:hypothetical protein